MSATNKKPKEYPDYDTEFDERYAFTKKIGLVTDEEYEEVKNFYYRKLRGFEVS